LIYCSLFIYIYIAPQVSLQANHMVSKQAATPHIIHSTEF
jgi:hypothetical protein